MIFIYEFSDGEIYTLINKGFSTADILALEDVHGKCLKIKREPTY